MANDQICVTEKQLKKELENLVNNVTDDEYREMLADDIVEMYVKKALDKLKGKSNA